MGILASVVKEAAEGMEVLGKFNNEEKLNMKIGGE